MSPGIKTFIIDGFNLLRRVPEFAHWEKREGLEGACQRLEGLLRARLQNKQERFFLIWDGVERRERQAYRGRLTVIFSGPEKADREVIRLAREWKNRATVVSDDGEIRRLSSAAGAQIMDTSVFAAYIESGSEHKQEDSDFQKPAPPMTAEEIAFWKNLFKKGKPED